MPADPVPAWPRPNRVAATGDKARQHYIAFFQGGAADVEVAAADLPPGDPLAAFKVEAYDDAGWIRGWTSGPLGAFLAAEPRVDAAAVAAADAAMAAWANVPDPLTLASLQGGMALCKAFARAGAVAVLDVVALRWWAPADLLALAPDREFAVGEHVSLTVETERLPGAPGHFLHTRGLAKFARPDLGIHVPDPARAEQIALQVRAVAGALATGLAVRDGETTRVGGQAFRFAARPDDSGEASPLFFNRWLELLPPLALG